MNLKYTTTTMLYSVKNQINKAQHVISELQWGNKVQ